MSVSPEEHPPGSVEELVRLYPNSARRMMVMVRAFSIEGDDGSESDRAQTAHLSPFGVEFYSLRAFSPGALLKIYVPIPDFWRRKQRYVSYKRIDVPTSLQILAKVVTCQERSKFGRKKLILTETVNIDRIDEEVLKEYLGEEKSHRGGLSEKLEVNFS